MDVLTNNRINVAHCNISGLTTCIGNTNTCVSNVLGCAQTATSNISGLTTCIGNTNTCVSNVLGCVQGHTTCLGSVMTCLATKSQGKLGMELIGVSNANYNGCVCVSSPGKFQSYKIIGNACCWTYYCSQLTFGFYGGCSQGCSCNAAASYCCAQWSCGILYNGKCFLGSYMYNCAGAIAWPFGCSSGCLTSCTGCQFAFEIDIWPEDICNQNLGFKYHIKRYGGGGNYMCCTGVENYGKACNCCGADPSCLQWMCLTNPSATCSLGCAQIAIYGLNRLSC